MALQRTRSELSALLLQRIPDNPLHVITPAAVRAELLDIIASALNLADDGLPNATPGVASFGTTTGSPFDSPALTAALNRGPNNRPDLRKGVRYLTVAESTAGGGGDSLEALAAAGVCLFTEATVEFYRPDPAGPTTRGQVLVAEYDGSATPALLGFRDAGFTGLPLPLHWVPQQERRDALPYALAPAGYLFATAQFVSAFVPDASTEQFFHPLADGPQPVGPTSKDGDAHWTPVAREDVPAPPVAAPTYKALTVAQAQVLAADPDGIAAIRYRILRGAAGDVETYGLPSDQANNRPGAFAQSVWWQNPAFGDWERKSYDAFTDTLSPSRVDVLESDLVDLENEVATLQNEVVELATTLPDTVATATQTYVDEHYGVFNFLLEVKNPPLTAGPVGAKGFRTQDNTAYLFTDGGAKRMYYPAAGNYGLVLLRLAETATAPLVLTCIGHSNGAGRVVTLQPGDTVGVRLSDPNDVVSATTGATDEWLVVFRSNAATGSTTLVVESTDGLRVSRAVPVTQVFAITAETLDANAAGVTYQLDTRTRTARAYGAPDRTLAQINALLAALTPTEVSEGAKLYIKTVPAIAANPSTVYLTI